MFRFGRASKKQSPPSSQTNKRAAKEEKNAAALPPATPSSHSIAEAEDLLVQHEDAEFEASVLAARARRSAQDPQQAVLESEEMPDDAIVEWAEQDDVYRPERVDAQEYIAALALTPVPQLKYGESLILVRSTAIETAQAHLRSDLRIELGGLLVGKALYDPAQDLFLIVVEAALPALNGEGAATTFSYTAASWLAMMPQLVEMQAHSTIVGTYHSHPGLGVFLSTTDRETQAEVFPHDWQIALVVDPVADKAGYFIGVSGKRCKALVY